MDASDKQKELKNTYEEAYKEEENKRGRRKKKRE